jgi:hypothetical protein
MLDCYTAGNDKKQALFGLARIDPAKLGMPKFKTI